VNTAVAGAGTKPRGTDAAPGAEFGHGAVARCCQRCPRRVQRGLVRPEAGRRDAVGVAVKRSVAGAA